MSYAFINMLLQGSNYSLDMWMYAAIVYPKLWTYCIKNYGFIKKVHFLILEKQWDLWFIIFSRVCFLFMKWVSIDLLERMINITPYSPGIMIYFKNWIEWFFWSCNFVFVSFFLSFCGFVLFDFSFSSFC